jgi:hypothetical protein
MHQVDWLAAFGFFVTFGLLVTGLLTGRMPNTVIEPERATNPIWFWALAAVYGFGRLILSYLVASRLLI